MNKNNGCIEAKASVTMMDVTDILVVICWKYQGRRAKRFSQRDFNVRFLVSSLIIDDDLLGNGLIYI